MSSGSNCLESLSSFSKTELENSKVSLFGQNRPRSMSRMGFLRAGWLALFGGRNSRMDAAGAHLPFSPSLGLEAGRKLAGQSKASDSELQTEGHKRL